MDHLEAYQAEVNALSNGRYILRRNIGSGGYGGVFEGIDLTAPGAQEYLVNCRANPTLQPPPETRVALKRVNEAIFEGSSKLTNRIHREVSLLAHFEDSNIIALRDVLVPPDDNFTFFWFAMELMDSTLEAALKHARQQGHPAFHPESTQYLLYQTVRALCVIHQAGVLHRDLQPANILCNSSCEIKICDFGLSAPLRPQVQESSEKNPDTPYVTMRWYRAPEIVMEHGKYTGAVDVWSVGLLFAEMLGSSPLCRGRDHVEQLDKIVEVTGSPSPQEIASVGSGPAQKYARKLKKQPLNLAARFPAAPPAAIDLLGKMLVFHPDKRITMLEALRHPYFAELYDPEDEAGVAQTAQFVLDESQLTTNETCRAALRQTAERCHSLCLQRMQQAQATNSAASPDEPQPATANQPSPTLPGMVGGDDAVGTGSAILWADLDDDGDGGEPAEPWPDSDVPLSDAP